MTITPATTQAQFQVELGKLGIDCCTWLCFNGKHIVTLYGPGLDGAPMTELGQGYGKTYVEALDDAFTSLVHGVGSELAKED
jgi:hypothetical protein